MAVFVSTLLGSDNFFEYLCFSESTIIFSSLFDAVNLMSLFSTPGISAIIVNYFPDSNTSINGSLTSLTSIPDFISEFFIFPNCLITGLPSGPIVTE